MARTYIDCREFPSEMNCTVAIAADSEKELPRLPLPTQPMQTDPFKYTYPDPK